MGLPKTQQINTTSFAETEMIVMYGNMPTVMWTRYFIEVQGYLLKPSQLHQDNTSVTLLESG
jgi:hypothetical protein